MSFEVAQHTADIRLQVTGATLEELFADAVRGLMSVMRPAGERARGEEVIEVDGADLTAALVDLLNEVLLRCHTTRRWFEPESIVLRDAIVTARLRAREAEEFEEDVKAVTYHEADVRRMSDGSWATTVVLDV